MGQKSGKKQKDFTQLSDEDINRLTKNTSYSREQIQEWHQGFLHDCPYGKVDKKKFIDVYKKFYPEGKAENFCTQVFKAFDSDDNGFIDFVEFIVAVNITSHGDAKDKLQLAFEMYDMNKNGKKRDEKDTHSIASSHTLLTSSREFVSFFLNNITMGHKGSKDVSIELDDETIDRLTKNTNYTPEQIRQWHQAFLRDCPTGKLSSRQFTEVYKKFYPEHEAEKYSAQVFRTFDMDNNGYIDFMEFLLAVNINSNGDVRDKLGLAFDLYDMNSNGQIDKKEMTKVITAIYELLGEDNRKGENSPENRVKKIMEQLDLNDDKNISRDEFVAGCLKDDVLRKLLAPNV
ncbi:unnamed protein product [Rotaria magnacalcarata]|uniref:EF-hand domain-containing protein n=3 Tax=Rotaria magnacalcarata TaxID=392030 RepID=A0A819MWM4_9BILA|nr:unnamed protein product [Rotaria magnacalcarata]CAF3986677.1 unnamed protein product [Rotaria magnacalcarata]CAF3998526.1 unnamed protein product [Rotaria magnacalcarata]